MLKRPRFLAGKTVSLAGRRRGAGARRLRQQADDLRALPPQLCRRRALRRDRALADARDGRRRRSDSTSSATTARRSTRSRPIPRAWRQFAGEEDWVGKWLGGPYPCGLQIAEPAIVAAACDATVVTQFRPVDHAFGGSGAPLMQFLDFVAFRDIGPMLTLNIGGIANLQLADKDRRRMMAFDTGPGNVMLDHAARVLLGKPYDADGARRRAARSTRSCWRACWRTTSSSASRRAAPGGSISAPNSPTGRSPRMRRPPPEDLLATFTEFTAASIVKALGARADPAGDFDAGGERRRRAQRASDAAACGADCRRGCG